MAGYTESMTVSLCENIARFLARIPGSSFVAEQDADLAGALLCRNDGRRGYLHHLAVSRPHPRGGIGWALVKRSLGALAAIGIRTCHIFVLAANQDGRLFWQQVGWQERTTLLVMSRDVE